MKKLFIYFLLAPLLSVSQGLINNGAQIVFSGNAQIYIDGTAGNYLSQPSSVPTQGNITPSSTSSITLLGNWTNNSANVAFTADGGGVVLAGSTQAVSGSSATAFYNLTLAGNGVKTLAVSSTTVGGQSTYTGILSVGASTLDLNSNRLDITNSAPGAITSAANGYIISETPTAINPSIIRWFTRTTTGSHVYPFGVAGSKIPFTFNVTTAMAGTNDYIDVSTRATAAPDNLPWAGASNLGGPVTLMMSPNGMFPDGSDEVVIDRWWDVTNSSPVTADMTFSYRGIENTLLPGYNAGFIGPQYWNGAGWRYDNLIIGSGAAAVLTGVGTVSVGGVSTFCPWVLSAKLSPLPIDLLNFEANCNNKETVIEWCTASEKDNSYFTIEHSTDGVNFQEIAIVQGSGTTNEKHCYNYITQTGVADLNYYRLKITDSYNMSSNKKTVSVKSCDANTDNVVITNNGTQQVGVLVNASSDYRFELYIHNSLGQILETKEIDVKKGFNSIVLDLNTTSNGVYYITAINTNVKVASKKIIISDIGR